MVLIQNGVDLLSRLKELEKAIIHLPRRKITATSAATYDRLEFIFHHYIDIHNTNFEDIVNMMEKNKIGRDVKNLVIAKWVSKLHEIETIDAWNKKQKLINTCVLNIVT